MREARKYSSAGASTTIAMVVWTSEVATGTTGRVRSTVQRTRTTCSSTRRSCSPRTTTTRATGSQLAV